MEPIILSHIPHLQELRLGCLNSRSLLILEGNEIESISCLKNSNWKELKELCLDSNCIGSVLVLTQCRF